MTLLGRPQFDTEAALLLLVPRQLMQSAFWNSASGRLFPTVPE
jgi:hypothetical protein